MKTIILILLICLASFAQADPLTCVVKRDTDGRISRNPSIIAKFKKLNPCPATGLIAKKCPGYVVDHIVPLCGCGADAQANLQWQNKADSLIKDRWERKLCRNAGDQE